VKRFRKAIISVVASGVIASVLLKKSWVHVSRCYVRFNIAGAGIQGSRDPELRP
jgi:hypothetical protein